MILMKGMDVMMRIAIKLCICLCLFTTLLVSCNPDPAADGQQPLALEGRNLEVTLPIMERDFKVGIAGLVYRNYPNGTDEDFLAFLNKIPMLGEFLGVYTNWDSEDLFEQIDIGMIRTEGVLPLVAIGYEFDDITETYFEEHSQAFHAMVLEVVSKYDLPYMIIGVEVNRLHTHYGEKVFLDFVETYRNMYDAVKAEKPQVKVFPVFQLEYMKGAAYLTGMQIEPQWELLNLFDGKMDLVGFTIYPFIEYLDLNDVPENYYEEILDHTDLPIAITEMGWPSEDLVFEEDTVVVSGNQQAQVDFLLSILKATKSMDIDLLMYSFLHDLPADIEVFGSIALKKNDGTPKLVYDYWQALAKLPQCDEN